MNTFCKHFMASQGWRLRWWRNYFLSRSAILLATLCGLPGIRFAWFGIHCARVCRKKGKTDIAEYLNVTPVNCWRYFEFDFARRVLINNPPVGRALDISSPNLFGLYLLNKRRISHLDVVNPDTLDLATTRALYEACIGDAEGRVEYHKKYVNELQWGDNTFDVIWSICVIEHIPGSGDEEAISKIERLLKPGGLLVLTTTVSAVGWDEYRDQDMYSLPEQNVQSSSGVFFERWYDESSVKGRLFDKMPKMQLEQMTIWGETKAGWFDAYQRRWARMGASETCKDALNMLTRFRKYSFAGELPGAGVVCMCLRKKME